MLSLPLSKPELGNATADAKVVEQPSSHVARSTSKMSLHWNMSTLFRRELGLQRISISHRPLQRWPRSNVLRANSITEKFTQYPFPLNIAIRILEKSMAKLKKIDCQTEEATCEMNPTNAEQRRKWEFGDHNIRTFKVWDDKSNFNSSTRGSRKTKIVCHKRRKRNNDRKLAAWPSDVALLTRME